MADGERLSVALGHAHRLRLAVTVRRGQASGLEGGEGGLAHADRIEHQLAQRAIEVLARRLLEHAAEHVEAERVDPPRARREEQRRLRQPPQVLVERDLRRVEPVGDAEAMQRTIRRLEEAIAEPGGVRD